jgi:pre-mRNA cleavage complex 2 protein Pcf11
VYVSTSASLANLLQTRPEWKLPALYVLDSIVKNVGTPYTVYLGRNLYRTFMGAYTVMPEQTRKAMEALLKTWKEPVPESMDARPVFPVETTREIESTLMEAKAKLAKIQAPTFQGLPTQLPPRPASYGQWRNTPTPPPQGLPLVGHNETRHRQVSVVSLPIYLLSCYNVAMSTDSMQ